MSNSISVSVVCPTYNSAQYVQQTIESVLQQTLPADELIIVDDGSSDETVSVLNKLKEKYCGSTQIIILNEFHRGPGAARNRGVEIAKSDWIAFIDSDDIWKNNKLEKIISIIKLNPDPNIYCHSELYIPLSGKETTLNYGKYYNKGVDFKKLLYKVNLFSTSATVCNRSLFNNAGYFDEELSSAQDFDLWLKFAPYLNPIFINEVLGVYNERVGNISTTRTLKRLKNIISVYKRYRRYVSSIIYFRQVSETILYFIYNFLKKKFI